MNNNTPPQFEHAELEWDYGCGEMLMTTFERRSTRDPRYQYVHPTGNRRKPRSALPAAARNPVNTWGKVAYDPTSVVVDNSNFQQKLKQGDIWNGTSKGMSMRSVSGGMGKFTTDEGFAKGAKNKRKADNKPKASFYNFYELDDKEAV